MSNSTPENEGCLWKTYNGFEVPVDFKNQWKSYNGFEVPVEFSCSGDDSNYTLFSGFLAFSTGESLSANLQTSLLVKLYEGQSLSATITYGDSFLQNTRFWEGQNLNSSITTSPGFIVNQWTGESLGAVLVSQVVFSLDLETGEYLSGYIETPDRYISDIDFYDGQFVSAELTWTSLNLPVQFSIGESLESNLSVKVNLATNFYAGENLSVEFSTNESWQIVSNLFTGENLLATILPIRQFGGKFSIGESLSSDLRVYSPWIQSYLYTGEYLQAEVSPVYDLGNSAFYTGEYFVPGIEFRMSGPIQDGPIGLATGEFLWFTLKTFKAVHIIPISLFPIPGSQVFIADIWSRKVGYTSTNLELTTDTCCPKKNGWENIELDEQPNPSERYVNLGTGQWMTASLWAENRLHPFFGVGESLKNDPNTFPLIRFNNNYGGFRVTRLQSNFTNIILNVGNLIPDPDSFDIELAYTYQPGSQSYHFNTGESLNVRLAEVEGFIIRIKEGANLNPDIKLDPAIRPRIHVGEYLYGHIQDIFNPVIRFGEGSELVAEIFDPPIIPFFGIGESLYSGDIYAVYHVAFSELGCLPNEYIPIDEDGDPIPDLFNPIPVELDTYQHQIQAYCY